MNAYKKTIQTYDDSAEALAAFFKGVGPRTRHIERALELAHANSNTHVIEIGCGDGRDATEIVKRVAWYEGFDPSEGLLQIARRTLPGKSFVLADALSYNYPNSLDVVYAFASLLHIPKEDLPTVFQKVHDALRPDGVFYFSVKERPAYTQELKRDEFGERQFYYYSPDDMKELAGDLFSIVYEEHEQIGKTMWLIMALKKN